MADWNPPKETPLCASARRRIDLLRRFSARALSLDSQERERELSNTAIASLLSDCWLKIADDLRRQAGGRGKDLPKRIETIQLNPLWTNPHGVAGAVGKYQKVRPNVIQAALRLADETFGSLSTSDADISIARMQAFAASFDGDDERYVALHELFARMMDALRREAPGSGEGEIGRLKLIAVYDGLLATSVYRKSDPEEKFGLLQRRHHNDAAASWAAYRHALSSHPNIATPLGDLTLKHIASNELQLLAADPENVERVREIVVTTNYFQSARQLCELFEWSEADARHGLSIASYLSTSGKSEFDEEMRWFGARLLRCYEQVAEAALWPKSISRSHELYDYNLPLFSDSYPIAKTPAMQAYMERIHSSVLEEFRSAERPEVASQRVRRIYALPLALISGAIGLAVAGAIAVTQPKPAPELRQPVFEQAARTGGGLVVTSLEGSYARVTGGGLIVT